MSGERTHGVKTSVRSMGEVMLAGGRTTGPGGQECPRSGGDLCRRTFLAPDYDLDATLTSGQAFRWERSEGGWQGVIGSRWVRLRRDGAWLAAESVPPVSDWRWLIDYFQLEVSLDAVLRTFPQDAPMRAAVAACRGLRLLRQDPWECLASFILSSTKQIVQIRQIVSLLCRACGEPVPVPPGCPPMHRFPTPAQVAGLTEQELRGCKMGFRAPNLLATARRLAAGQFDLSRLHGLEIEAARAELMQLPGVGRKVADCVLLFAYGSQTAFPVDVWVLKGLHRLYFPRRRVTLGRLHQFAAGHFGPHAGYAQQYLFHYLRTARGAAKLENRSPKTEKAARPRRNEL